MSEPLFRDDWLTVYQGDCRAVMASMEPESVHCVVTSPPYWGLRDYGDAGQLGLEPTPEEYVANLVDVFREVRRVLRSDGTVWLNLGDSYAGSGKGGNPEGSVWSGFVGSAGREASAKASRPYLGLAQKQLVGIPWRVAFALQADGWYLRSDIIWAKPNPMPESVTDRPTKSHEYLFLLSKSARYYFDADAVREAAEPTRHAGRMHPRGWHTEAVPISGGTVSPTEATEQFGRNLRSVWTIATQPYPGAHFATFPRKLVEPCIKAGTSEFGVCSICGAPWERIGGGDSRKAGCKHTLIDGALPIPATVLDPFAGSGTVGLVAQSLSRRAVLIDLNADYLIQAMGRNRDIPLGLVS